MKSIGITGNINNRLVPKTLEQVIKWCRKHKIDYKVDSLLPNLKLLRRHFCRRGDLWKGNDLLISLGGDGTLLSAVQALGEHQIPVLGINLGGLGFLTQLDVKEVERGLNLVKKSRFQVEQRMVLQVQRIKPKSSKIYYALNDAVLHKGEIARLISFEVKANAELICSYMADGLIVSTPTGSTAYSLAADGPIIHPDLDAIIVTPICPQTMASRSFIFSAPEQLVIKLGTVRESSHMMIDGQIWFRVKKGEEIEIKKAAHKVRMIKFPGYSFYSVLRQKLHWGVLPGQPI